jgi:hypothetical protein
MSLIKESKGFIEKVGYDTANKLGFSFKGAKYLFVPYLTHFGLYIYHLEKDGTISHSYEFGGIKTGDSELSDALIKVIMALLKKTLKKAGNEVEIKPYGSKYEIALVRPAGAPVLGFFIKTKKGKAWHFVSWGVMVREGEREKYGEQELSEFARQNKIFVML